MVKAGNIEIGRGRALVLMAGPCVIENERQAFYHAERLLKITDNLKLPLIYKSSYDKANRSSGRSFRGPGISKGLAILKKIKKSLGLIVTSDVHCRQEIEESACVLDIIQIPAFLCRQTDLLTAAARTGRPVNVKKGQFMAPWDMQNVLEKIKDAGGRDILLTERGTSFGYNNLVSDMRSLPIMRGMGYPVIYDATHSVQLPSGQGRSSGGQKEFVSYLAMASVAVGIDGIFIETHKDPGKALSDGPNMVAIKDLGELLQKLKAIREALGDV
ncbi:MAG: 3-deoxy-8-phosphooctulonate synthase [Candidatus Omnitrophica bacterium]|nr:3-deoxy-8-phosphooctulonate synthase [Candidatus Omnitrophota bacterium]